ncbi:hypothetical protein EXIGLDRAFT_828895 [Exidia glandulosa HHB12029]|uniref:F-box domain-containing protein n=1 Tax=Exidia glandulosa HHB12029 TaxID=1314781 RepID=A0A165PWC5_EXIGL|nr:hypothetical protein EXIGLDRAFT_828895 [Exidia glandulosa HHB12029]
MSSTDMGVLATPVLQTHNCCSGLPLTLASLPIDVLLLICDALLSRRRWVRSKSQHIQSESVPRVETYLDEDPPGVVYHAHPLASLSGTRKSFRTICMPTLFRSISLSDTTNTSPPSSILPHVCVLRYRGSDVGSRARHDHMQLFSLMPNLRELRCYRSGVTCAPCDSLNLACAAPALEFLYLNDLHPTMKDMSVPSPHLPLRALKIFLRSRFSVLGTIPTTSLVDSCRRLELLMEHSRHAMEELVLPGESTRLSFLALQPWPRLHTLVLCGAVPTTDSTFLQVLIAMPNLRALTLAIAPLQGLAVPVLWAIEAETPLQPDLTQLQHLAIAYPAVDDRVFQHLSLNLRTLALRDMPRYWVRKRYLEFDPADPVRTFAAPLLTYSRLRRILQKFDGTLLERLEVVVIEDDCEGETLKQLASSCPNLRFFELHRYRRQPIPIVELPRDPTMQPTPVVELSHYLSALTTLRTLRVNVDLYPGRGQRYRDWDAWDRFIDGLARMFVESLPWLRRFALLCSHSNGFTAWRTWTVNVQLDGKACLEEEQYSSDRVEAEWM